MIAVSVKQHGAIGDNIANDTDAFLSAQQTAVENGSFTVYLPPGQYLAEIVADPRMNFVGERNQSLWSAFNDGAYALTYGPPPPFDILRNQLPFIQGITFHGKRDLENRDDSDKKRHGLFVNNQAGIDLIDVTFYHCDTGLYSTTNFYGTWNRLKVVYNRLGILLQETSAHTGNKRLFNPHIRVNDVGVVFEGNCRGVAFYGGTIEGNGTGAIYDLADSGQDTWRDATAQHLRDIWFEANITAKDYVHTLPDGTVVPPCDLYVNRGTVVLTNASPAHTYVKQNGRLFSYFSFVGVGPVGAFLDIEQGGYFEPHNTLSP